MAKTILRTLPAVSVVLGQTLVSPAASVPVGGYHVQLEIDAAAWAADVAMAAAIDFSSDGGANWQRIGAITADRASMTAEGQNACGVGFFLAATANSRIRGSVTCTAGAAGFTLAGTLTATD